MLGCQTPNSASLEGVTMSFNEVKKAVAQTIPGGIMSQSINGREIQSHYFSRKEDIMFDPQQAKERAYVFVYILGDRRPYTVEVQVPVEEKTKQGYSKAGLDKALAEKYALAIRKRLTQSREDRNVIDDFRVF